MSDARTSHKVTRVAVGVLLRSDGSVLLADRPAGKPYSGYWEFPGGKVEPGEAVATALARELHEELGIDIGAQQPWITFEFDYPHAFVQLHFHRIYDWQGEPHPREGQRLRFVHPAHELPQPLLPAAVPALRWLKLPEIAIVVGANAVPRNIEQRLGAARRIVVIDRNAVPVDQLRSDTGVDRCAVIRPGDLMLACGDQAADIPGCDGVVLNAKTLNDRPLRPTAQWRGAWVNSASQMASAACQGVDFALVSAAFVAANLGAEPAAIPMLVAASTSEAADRDAAGQVGHGRWFDLRVPDSCGQFARSAGQADSRVASSGSPAIE